jgi:hypothetical protein
MSPFNTNFISFNIPQLNGQCQLHIGIRGPTENPILFIHYWNFSLNSLLWDQWYVSSQIESYVEGYMPLDFVLFKI